MRSNDAKTTRRSVRLAALAATCTLPFGLAACGSSSKHAAAQPSSAAASTSRTTTSTSTSSAAAASSSTTAPTTSSSASAPTRLSAAKAVTSATSTVPAPTTRSVVPSGTASTASAPRKATKRPAITRVDLAPVKSTSSGAMTGAEATPRLSYTTRGRTLSYAFGASGRQHEFKAEDGTVMAYPYPASATISFGDGTSDDGADAGMACLPKSPLSPLNGMSPRATHTYAKPGTYTVTVRSLFCGDAGATAAATTYRITVR